MPAVALAAAGAVAGAGVASWAGLTVGTLAFATTQAVVAFVVTSAGAKFLAKDTPTFSQEQQGRLQIIRSAVQPHRIIYGESMVSGTLVAAATSNRSGTAPPAAVGLTVKNDADAGATSLVLAGYDGTSPLQIAEGATFTLAGNTYTLTADAQWFAGHDDAGALAERRQPSGLTIQFTPGLAAAATAGTATSLTFQPPTADAGKKNEYLHMVIALAGHEVHEIGDVYFNELPSSDARFSPGGVPYFHIERHLGSPTQTAEPMLMAAFPDDWTADHRLQGIAYLYVRLRWSADVWPAGIPNIKAVVKGRKVYDPRTATTGYSNNWALCVRDYLTAAFGLGCTAGEIDDAAFIAAANVSDEAVALDGLGATQARYTCDGSFDLSQTPQDILAAMLTAGAGMLPFQGGKWRLLPGAYRTPAVEDALNEDDLRGPIGVQAAPSRRDLFNAVRGTYADPAKQWQLTDFPLVSNAAYATQDGDTIYRDIELPFTTDPIRAQRIAKIQLEKSRQGITVDFPAKLTALRYRVGDVVKLSIAQLGWSAKDFIVTRWALAPDGGVDLTLQEEAAACYDWNFGNATVVDPAPDTTLRSAFTIDPPTNLRVIEDLYFDASGYHSAVTVRWQNSTDARVVNHVLQVSVAGENDWQSIPTEDERWTIAPAPAGAYDVRVKAVSFLGQSSPWVSASLTVTGSHPLLTAIGLPEPASVQVFASPDGQGVVSRMKVRFRLEDWPSAPDGLAVMVSVTPQPIRLNILADEGTRLKIAPDSVLSRASGEYIARAGSTRFRLVTNLATAPLPTDINLGGRVWAQFSTSEWRKVTSYDATGFNFREPFDIDPPLNAPIQYVELSWYDDRDFEFRLHAAQKDGAMEVIRVGRVDQEGENYYVADLDRAQEGTTQINATGGTLDYYPAPGAGTEVITFPFASLIDQGGGVYEGETDANVVVPAGYRYSLTAATWRQTTSGIVRSPIVVATVGGPL